LQLKIYKKKLILKERFNFETATGFARKLLKTTVTQHSTEQWMHYYECFCIIKCHPCRSSLKADVLCKLLLSQSSCLVEPVCATACDGIRIANTYQDPNLTTRHTCPDN